MHLALLPLVFVVSLLATEPPSRASFRVSISPRILANGGSVVGPNDPEYAEEKLIWNVNKQIDPSLIVKPKTEGDVAFLVRTAATFGVSLRARSGGHSFEGFSTHSDVVVDMRNFNSVNLNAATNTLTTGGGALFSEIDPVLDASDYIMIGAGCHHVGVAAFTQGGGHSQMTGTGLGMAIDNVLNFRVAIADGSIINVNANEHADLFWAMRGSGAGSWGIVTELTIRVFLHPQPILRMTAVYPLDSLAAVTGAYFAATAALNGNDKGKIGRVSFDVSLLPTGSSVDVSIVYDGTEQEFNSENFLATFPPADSVNISVAKLHAPTASSLLDELYPSPFPIQYSHVFLSNNVPITEAVISSMLAGLPPSEPVGLGGVLSLSWAPSWNVGTTADYSFPYTGIGYNMLNCVGWVSPELAAVGTDFISSWHRAFREGAPDGLVLGGYNNYVHILDEDWPTQLWGTSLDTLQSIKSVYDTKNIWQFPRSVPAQKDQPETGEEWAVNFNNNNNNCA